MKPLRRNERSKCAPQVRMAASISASEARVTVGRRRLSGGWQRDAVEQRRDRPAGRLPVRRVVVAGPDQALAQRLEPIGIAQFGQTGPPQQRPQHRIAQRGLVELAEVAVAALIFQQDRIAHVI